MSADALVERLSNDRPLVIICHDDPDPDCIASAFALAEIAAAVGVEDVRIVYGGDISHQQNRTLVNLLEIDLEDVDDASVLAATADRVVALVDHSRPSTRFDLPAELPVDVVVDHHATADPVSAPFVDVREEYGATASIFAEYLRELDVTPSSQLASALLFALHRERLDNVRRPTQHEYEAARFVFPSVDLDLLERMYGSALSPATLDAIGEAIRRREVRGSSLVSGVGRTTERDSLPQAADNLLNLEGVDTVLVFGIVGETIHLSSRSVDPRVDVGTTLQQAFGDVGSVGGHQDMSGGQIPLGLFADEADDDEELLQFVSTRITNRFFDVLRLEEETGGNGDDRAS